MFKSESGSESEINFEVRVRSESEKNFLAKSDQSQKKIFRSESESGQIAKSRVSKTLVVTQGKIVTKGK